jgi:thioredoxin-disulfide reductase
MAPIFKKVAAEFRNQAVFVKIDTNAQYELSSRYQIRSLPTFLYFLHGKTAQQPPAAVGGIGEQALRQQTKDVIRQADIENTVLSLEALMDYYKQVDRNKSDADIQAVYKKCVDMNKKAAQCVGNAANTLARKLRQKYNKQAPKLIPRFTEDDRKSKKEGGGKGGRGGSDDSQQQTKQTTGKKASSSSGSDGGGGGGPNLHLATVEQLQLELEKRMDELRDQQVEQEDEDEDESDYYSDFTTTPWKRSGFPEHMIIIGGGPAGLSAAIYGARAGLAPLIIAPSMGGQLQGKGVDVENYPGLHNMTGPGVVASMRKQAAHFGAVFEDDVVVSIDASVRPMKVQTNSTGVIETHTIVVATGAEANWLGVKGEWELRGGGVSSCAICDGFLYSGKDVIVVGGGDAAMEDALVLARTSKSVTLVHRRDKFRASKVLADRVMEHPLITVAWNKVVKEIKGKNVQRHGDDSDNQDMDSETTVVVSQAILEDTVTGEETSVNTDAVFIAIGHTPSTQFLQGVVEFDSNHAGYVRVREGTTQTSVDGIFAAGDVADSVYRQAITSAGSGAAAALDAERYLSENGLGNEAAEFEAELLAEMSGNDSSRESYNVYEDAGGRMEGMKESVISEL